MADGPDYKLRSQVDTVQQMIVQVDQQISRVGNEVNAVSTAQRQTQTDLAQLRSDFHAFTQTAERVAAVQRAETKIGVLQDTLEREFGHHNAVRRSAIGLLQAFDLGIVSEEAVRAVSEELMIQTPRYWLAPALVALSAWSADQLDLCGRATAEAYRRSPSKTSLLFTLVLRRQGRMVGSVRWLAHYLPAQDPRALGRDFAVILEAVAQGAFGPAGRALVDETLASWSQALSDSDSQAAQVERWKAEVRSYRAPLADGDFPALAAVSPEWPHLGGALSGAEGHSALLAKFNTLMAEVVEAQDRIEDAMDDILDRLVKEYDDEELPLRREIALNEAVLARDGDVAAARTDAGLGVAVFDETRDYLTIQTQSALQPAALGVSRATQKIAVASCRAWIGQAHDQVTVDYRAQLPSDVGVTFSGTHNAGATVFQLPDWSGKLSAGLPQLEQSLESHWDAHTAAYVDSLAFPVAKKAIGPALITLVVAIVLISIAPLFGVLAALVVGGIFAFRLNRQYQQGLKAQEQARELLATWKQESLTQLRAAGAELTDWSTRFRQADGQADEVRAFVGALDAAGHAAAPFERRTVHAGAHAAGV